MRMSSSCQPDSPHAHAHAQIYTHAQRVATSHCGG